MLGAGMRFNSSLVLSGYRVDRDGEAFVTCKQYYRGVPVMGSLDYRFSANGKLIRHKFYEHERAWGGIRVDESTMDLNVVPSVKKSDAVSAFLSEVRNRDGRPPDTTLSAPRVEAEVWITHPSLDSLTQSVTDARLVWVLDIALPDEWYRKTQVFGYSGKVDAQTGALLQVRAHIPIY
jgi:hypothetical protein